MLCVRFYQLPLLNVAEGVIFLKEQWPLIRNTTGSHPIGLHQGGLHLTAEMPPSSL